MSKMYKTLTSVRIGAMMCSCSTPMQARQHDSAGREEVPSVTSDSVLAFLAAGASVGSFSLRSEGEEGAKRTGI